ncbi:MAG: hypothetical protein QOE11_1748 [Solirubrobacteraceae bacterium]|jgi:hypothetical protein|nr:hypothetical protein [Solirubrobacteraceae bacterium]
MSVTALGAGATVVAAPAQASLLGGLLPNVGTIVTGTGSTLGGVVDGILPGTGGVITGVTGTVGGVVGGVQDAVTGVVDQTLGGVIGGATGGLLPGNVLDSLLGTLLGNSSAAPGSPATGTSGGPIVLSGGSVTPNGIVLDASAPRPTVKILSKLKAIGKSGRMRMEIRTNEPGIVAVAGNIRPGAGVRAKGAKTAAKHSRKLIKVPSIVLGYRKAGKLVVTVKLSRAAQRALGKSKDAKMSVGTVASDVFKNQDSDNIKLKIKR